MRTTSLALCALLLSAGAANADCTSDVNDAFAKLRASKTFNMQTKITNASGTLTMSNDYVLPDRMYQRLQLKDGAPGPMEMILIGDKAWSNQGKHGWVPLPPEFAGKVAQQMKETVVEPPKDKITYTCLGDVEFEGKTYAAYSTKRAPGPNEKDAAEKKAEEAAKAEGVGKGNVQTVYIDKESGLPVRNIVTPEDAPEKRLFDGTFTKRADIKIEPPQS